MWCVDDVAPQPSRRGHKPFADPATTHARLNVGRETKTCAMPAHGRRTACAPAAARTHAAGVVAGRLARLPAVATLHRFGVPIVPIAPIGLNRSADLECPNRETTTAPMWLGAVADRSKMHFLLVMWLESSGNVFEPGPLDDPLRCAGTGDKPGNRGYMWRQ
jgi:hypothetical protein